MTVEGGKRGSHSARLGRKGQSGNRLRAGRKQRAALKVKHAFVAVTDVVRLWELVIGPNKAIPQAVSMGINSNLVFPPEQ